MQPIMSIPTCIPLPHTIFILINNWITNYLFPSKWSLPSHSSDATKLSCTTRSHTTRIPQSLTKVVLIYWHHCNSNNNPTIHRITLLRRLLHWNADSTILHSVFCVTRNILLRHTSSSNNTRTRKCGYI